jgi:hypothetical protein
MTLVLRLEFKPALHESYARPRKSLPQRRKGAKKTLLRNAAALCAFAREIFSEKILFVQSQLEL